MKLNPIGSNQTEVELASGVTVFFSYKTPVAAHIPGRGCIRTDQYYSRTTTKHINQWLNDKIAGDSIAKVVPQANIDSLV